MEDKTFLYKILEKHVGHRIEITSYADGENISLECMDCNEVIFDTDLYELVGLDE